MRIYEARRNPSKSKRTSGHEEAIDFLEKLPRLDNVAIRMTDLPKLGINPTFSYNTPLGICFYPAEYYFDTITSNLQLPFMNNAHFIQIFQYNTNNVLYINDLSNDEGKQIIKALIKYNKANPSGHTIKELWEQSDTEALVPDKIGGKLWFIMYKLIQNSKNPAMAWHTLLKSYLDKPYDVVLDTGDGIIHKNERVQGVIINPTVVKPLTQVEQTYKHKSKPSKKAIGGPTAIPKLVKYAMANLKRLPPNLEEKLITTDQKHNRSLVMDYFKTLVKKPWPKFEDEFLLHWRDPKLIHDYFMITRQPFPAAEPLIFKSLYTAVDYALYASRKPMPNMLNVELARDAKYTIRQNEDKINKYIKTFYPNLSVDEFVKSFRN